jgi:hypothetical protein
VFLSLDYWERPFIGIETLTRDVSIYKTCYFPACTMTEITNAWPESCCVVKCVPNELTFLCPHLGVGRSLYSYSLATNWDRVITDFPVISQVSFFQILSTSAPAISTDALFSFLNFMRNCQMPHVCHVFFASTSPLLPFRLHLFYLPQLRGIPWLN